MRSYMFFSTFDTLIWRFTFPSQGRLVRRPPLPWVSCQDWHGCLSAHYYLFLQGVSQNLWILEKHWRFRSDLEVSTFDFRCPLFSGGGSKVTGEFSFVLPTFSGGDYMFSFSSFFCESWWVFLPSILAGVLFFSARSSSGSLLFSVGLRCSRKE